MDALPAEARIRNVTSKDTCGYCLNDGLVVTSTRPSKNPESPFEQMGPCPYCERGFAHEFPNETKGPWVGRPGVWGEDGYWSSRRPEEAAAIVKQDGGQPLSALANRERVVELTEDLDRKSEERAAKAEAEASERRIAAEAERAQALAEVAARDSGEVADLGISGSASKWVEGEEDASTVSAARDSFPEPPPESSTGLFG